MATLPFKIKQQVYYIMPKLIFLLLFVTVLSCRKGEENVDHHNSGTAEQIIPDQSHQQDKAAGQTERAHHHNGAANAHMHQSSVADLVKRFESPERDAYQQPEKVLQYLGEVAGKTIMDIGAGSGYFSVKLAKKGASVIAADVNEEFQDYLRNRIEENKLAHIELRKIPYDSPDLKDNEVDIALMVNTYHHIEDRVDYFKKVKAGIKENGEVVIIDFFKSDTPVGPPVEYKISMDQIVAELKNAGFDHFQLEVNLLPYQFIVKAS